MEEKKQFETWEQTIKAVRSLSSEAIISFSRGKDSIAAYLAMQDKFEKITPYTYYIVPGLEFVEESLAYFEQKMGCRIVRYPAPAFYKMLNNMVYQPKEHIDIIERMELPNLSQDDLQRALTVDHNISEHAYNAIGMRSKDSVQRAFTIQRNGTINHTRKTFYPIHDWSKQDVIDCIRKAGWKLPIEYRYFGSSFDGLYANYLVPIRHFFPKDYQRILEFFPMAEMECLRFDAAVRAGKQPPYIPPKA
jgi:3'-phosphoadenosine 5'-phosphosulfate sulfotransferase (PAPS reductase)/FAD synthetase